MANQLLPIGTVVQLEDSTARVMIAGYLPTGPSRPGYVWDYSGFKFPIGYMDDDEIYLFDQGQIETVLALGFQETEQFDFIAKLEAAAGKLKSNTVTQENADDGQEDENV